MGKVTDILRRPKRLTPEAYLQKLISKGLNPDGTPVLDPTEMAPPIGYKKQPSMVDIVRDMIKSERLKAAAGDNDTFEEAEDFDVGDEPEQLRSFYENEGTPSLQDLLAAGAHETAVKKAAADKAEADARKSASQGAGTPGGGPPAPPEAGKAE